jgi:hypothetical protein
MMWKIILNKKKRLAKNNLSYIFISILLFILLPVFSYAVTIYQGIQPGKTTKDEVSGILGKPAKEINSSTFEYPPQTGTEKIVIEYKMGESTPIVDTIEVYFPKPIVKPALVKAMKLSEDPSSQKENPEGKLQEYYGSTKSLILTYQGKETKSGVKTVSYLSRERFESMSKDTANKTEELKPTPPSEESKKQTPATSGEKTEVAKLIPPEAKQHLQQGMTYASIAQNNPKTASQNYENALLEFSNALKLYPNYAEAYSNRGVAYMQQKKYNKAEEDLKKAAALKPKDPIIHYNLAALYSLQNKLDLALDELDEALEYGFNNYDALRPTGAKSDPDLKNLRHNPEFKKVLEKHKVFILK